MCKLNYSQVYVNLCESKCKFEFQFCLHRVSRECLADASFCHDIDLDLDKYHMRRKSECYT